MKLGVSLSIVFFALGSVVAFGGCGSGDDPPAADPGADGGSSTPNTPGGGGNDAASDGTSSPADGGGMFDGGTPGSDCSGTATDPAAAATINGYIEKLPFTKPMGAVRDQVIDAIIRTCFVFSPPASKSPGWEPKYCWAHLVGAISKESTYQPALSNLDAYGQRMIGGQTANDPTVGYLQIRFSSTVHDYATRGPLDKIACIGCALPPSFADHANEQGDSTFWAVTGPTANMSLMTTPACNIALGAWYYYVFSTANGNPSTVTYVNPYCAGSAGTAGNLITGLLSHLKGPSGGKGVIPNMAGVNALMGTDNNAYQYITQIKTMFDDMVGAVAGTHPFFIALNPDSTRYCR